MKTILFFSMILFSSTIPTFGQTIEGMYYYQTPVEQYLHTLDIKPKHSYKFTNQLFIQKGKWKISADTLILLPKKFTSKVRGFVFFGHGTTKYLLVNGILNKINSDSTKKERVQFSKTFPD